MGSYVYFIVLLGISYGFNLDPRFSLIKRGPANSYFGFSVAEHQIVDDSIEGKPQDLPVIENLILVGAPKANSEVLNINNTGAIYECDLDSSQEDDCRQLINEPFDQKPGADEKITDQWLGVTVRSQGKGQKVLACAHRYMEKNYGYGLCYTLLQGLDYHEKYRPCLGRPVQKLHQEFGVCQAGISGALLPDDGFLMGAPGAFNWRGVVFKTNVSEELGVDYLTYYSPLPKSEDEGSTGQQPPVDKYSYLGYSVTSGKFDKSGKKYYVSGAPRSKQTGEIVLFTQVPGSHLMYAQNQVIQGKRFFSAFGHELLSVDLNNDGYDDLIVGAPFYHTKNTGGAIYIYIGGELGLNQLSVPIEILSREMSDQECKKLQCEHARFGFSLAKVGDLNLDGFQDFAVGAPFEGKGSVYIFHGAKDGVVKQFAQRIDASDVPSPDLSSFGHSLSGGMDLDDNGYPDLVVGSYESNQIALIRARPIIHLDSKVTVEPEMIDLSEDPLCQFDDEARHCVQVEICLRFTAEPKDRFTSQPIILYKIEAEKSRSISRLTLKDATEINGRVLEASMKLNQQTKSDYECKTQIAYLEDTFQDKLNPLLLDIMYRLDEKPYIRPGPKDQPTDINKFPILATMGDVETTKTTVTAKVEFVKDCVGVCNSNLQFKAELSLPRDSDNNHVMSEGDVDVITLTVSVANYGEAAYLTKVYVEKPESLHYQGQETINATSTETEVKCKQLKSNASLIECEDIGNPLPKDHRVLFIVKLDPSQLESSKAVHNIVVWVNTSSEETTPESDRIAMNFRVIIIADITVTGVPSPDDPLIFKGNVVGESAIKIEDEIGPAINHTFVVTNFGPGNVPRSELIIQWPYQTENNEPQGQHLLYLMQSPQVMHGQAQCIERPEIINPLGIKTRKDGGSQSAPSRRKRSTFGKVRTKRKNSREVVLACGKTAKCHEIVCNLGELKSNNYVEIRIRARLWQSTLIRDYMNVGEVKIRSSAELYIDPKLNIESKQTTNKGYAVTLAIPDVKDQLATGLEWWIILVAVLAGVILLLLLILLLWKLGFFKRRKPEEMATYKVEVEKQKELEEEEA